MGFKMSWEENSIENKKIENLHSILIVMVHSMHGADTWGSGAAKIMYY